MVELPLSSLICLIGLAQYEWHIHERSVNNLQIRNFLGKNSNCIAAGLCECDSFLYDAT